MKIEHIACLVAMFLCTSYAPAQSIDSVAINAKYRYAHSVHEEAPDEARQICLDILQKSTQAGYFKGEGDACVTLGAICRNQNKLPESYEYLNRALKIRRTIGDSNRVAAVFTNLAINFLQESRYDSAIATVLYAIKIIEALPKSDYSVLGSEYLLLSNIYDDYLEPEDALKYARRSLYAYTRTNSNELIGKAAYTLGNRFLDREILDSSLIYYDQAYNNIMASSKDPDFIANILTNKAVIYTKQGNYARAGELFKAAEAVLENMGEDADYFHFYLNKGDWLIMQNDWAGALSMLKDAHPEDVSELSFLDRQFLFENLATAYAALNIPDSAYYYQKSAYAVRDSIYNDRKRKEFIRFQAERYKNESITEQAKAQKQSSRARLFLQSSVLLLLLLLLIIYAYVQRKRAFGLINQQREILHKQEVDELIQGSELRYLSAGLEGREMEKEQIARELHDRLGSAIVTLTWQYDAILENIDPASQNHPPLVKLNESLKHLYQDVRHIAHQLGSGVLERAGLIPVLTELCNDIEASKKIEVSFSAFGMENRLGFAQEINILRIIQELISNILKYAAATQLLLQINRIDDLVNIMVEDNGVGFDPRIALSNTGVGLNNVEARLRSLNGTMQFENRPAGGTTVIINIPVPKPDKFYDQAH